LKSCISEDRTLHSPCYENLKSSGANTCSAIQNIRSILWNSYIHILVHNSPSRVCILRQMNQFHSISFYFFKLHRDIKPPPLYLGLPKGSLYSGFLTKIFYEFLFLFMLAICSSNLILPYFVKLMKSLRHELSSLALMLGSWG
jgi:hypothetical protein